MLHVSLLGEQSITGGGEDGAATRTRSSRSVALVAFLVVHAGSPQPRQRIAGLFWPESTDAQALTNLRRELHHLRQVLGDEPSLRRHAGDLCWRDTETCRVDVRVFSFEREAALVAAAASDDEGVLAARRRRPRRVPGRPAARRVRGLAARRQVGDRTAVRGPVRPARRAASAQRRPGRGGGCRAAPDSAAAAGGDRLPHPDAAAGRAGRPGRRGQHLPPLRFGAGARAGRRPGRLDAQGVPAPDGSRTPGGQVPGDDGARDRAAGAGRGAALRPVSRARPAPGRVAGRGRRPLRPRARPRRSGCRQDPPGDRGRRDGTAAGRRGRELPVLRDVGAAGAGPGGGLAAQPRGPVGGGDPRPRLARRGRQADARPRATEGAGPGRGRWWTPGSATASTRASRGR